MERSRPYNILSSAITLDGKLGAKNKRTKKKERQQKKEKQIATRLIS